MFQNREFRILAFQMILNSGFWLYAPRHNSIIYNSRNSRPLPSGVISLLNRRNDNLLSVVTKKKPKMLDILLPSIIYHLEYFTDPAL